MTSFHTSLLHNIVELLLLPLDHFLTEVGTFCQLLLDFLVNLDLTLVRLNLLLHLIVLVYEDLGLLGLVLQFCGQLVVLKNSEMSRRLQLLVIHGQEIGLSLLDIEEHLFAKLLSLTDSVELFLVYLLKAEGFFAGKSFFEARKFICQTFFLEVELLHCFFFFAKSLEFVSHFPLLLLELLLHIVNSFFIFFFGSFEFSLQFLYIFFKVQNNLGLLGLLKFFSFLNVHVVISCLIQLLCQSPNLLLILLVTSLKFYSSLFMHIIFSNHSGMSHS